MVIAAIRLLARRGVRVPRLTLQRPSRARLARPGSAEGCLSLDGDPPSATAPRILSAALPPALTPAVHAQTLSICPDSRSKVRWGNHMDPVSGFAPAMGPALAALVLLLASSAALAQSQPLDFDTPVGSLQFYAADPVISCTNGANYGSAQHRDTRLAMGL